MWEIFVDIYNVLASVLFPVEQICYYTAHWPFWNRILVLQIANILLITLELLFLMSIKRGSRAISQMKTDNFLLRNLKKIGTWLIRLKTPKPLAKFGGWKKISFFSQAMFALTPDFQKVGVIVSFFRNNRDNLVWYVAFLYNLIGMIPVFVGGAVRMFLYPFMGQRIWILVLAMITLRFLIFLLKKIRNKKLV